MTDNLRDRIAELQRAHMPIDYAGGIDCTCGDNFHPDHGGIDVAEPLWAAHVADAVIRELGLREELRYPGRFSFMPPQRRRYVTEWETDD